MDLNEIKEQIQVFNTQIWNLEKEAMMVSKELQALKTRKKELCNKVMNEMLRLTEMNPTERNPTDQNPSEPNPKGPWKPTDRNPSDTMHTKLPSWSEYDEDCKR